MAYKAEIQIGVVGIGQLGALQKSLNQISSTVDLINNKQIDKGFSVQNINTYNAQLEKAWKNINKAAMGSQEELQAVKNLVTAKNNQISAQERLNKLIKEQELVQKRIVATSDAGFGVQGPAQAPSGITAALEKPGIADAIIGAGFPALFGGGPGAILGGGVGGLIGGAMGGALGMALSIGLSAVGQQLDEAVKRAAELGKVLSNLDVDKLRESFIRVNAELETTVRRAKEAGQADQARLAIAREIAVQTGGLFDSVERSAQATNRLGSEWQALTGTLSVLASLVTKNLVNTLTVVVGVINMAAKGINVIVSLFDKINEKTFGLLNIINPFPVIIEKLASLFPAINEEQEKLLASAIALSDATGREILNNQKLLELESQRTLGRTEAEKQINAELDAAIQREEIKAQYQQKALELREQFAGIESEAGKQALEALLAQNSALEQQELKKIAIAELLRQQAVELDANKQRYDNITLSIENQILSLERWGQINTSRFEVETALNNLYGAQLQRQYELANSAQERYNIVIKMFQQQVEAAKIEYQQALLNTQLMVERSKLEHSIVEVKYAQLEAEKAIAVAQAKARGNTEEQIKAIVAGYDKALGAQESAIEISKAQLDTTETIAKNQELVAEAVLKTKVIQAESQLAQRLVSKEIGFSKESADRLAGSLGSGAIQANNLAKQMASVAAQANNAANQLARVRNLSGGGGSTGGGSVQGAAEGAYWRGGFSAFAQGGVVTKPTLGLIGEGGEPEYILPQSKAGGFVENWLKGKRGEAAIPQSADSGGSVGPINIQTGPVMQHQGQNYVTLADLQSAMETMATTILNSSRSAGVRRYTGIR